MGANGRLVSKARRLIVNFRPRSAVDGLARLVWPPVCAICGRAADGADDWCRGCVAALPVAAGECRCCGVALPRSVDRCGACIERPPPFARTEAAFAYRPPLPALVQRFKFNGDPVAGRVLAELMARRLVARRADRPQLMVPVPLNWRREWRRGFNQAEWLCRDLHARLAMLPWAPVLVRRRATATQSELPAPSRAGNVRGAFELRALPPGARHVALVDDVMTTGATLRECARVLRRAGVQRVDVWVVARA